MNNQTELEVMVNNDLVELMRSLLNLEEIHDQHPSAAQFALVEMTVANVMETVNTLRPF